MKKLWFAFIIVATLGSIYPFDFHFVQLDATAFRSLLQTCCTKPGRGDILGNVILFLPFGFVGMFAVRPDSPTGRRFVFLGLIALVFATTLQVAQIYLPSRDENLQDVLWNLIGAAAGALLAVLADRYRAISEESSLDADIVPLALIATWLTYRLMPFVPSIDYQLIKDSVKPLFQPDLTFASIVPDVAAWLVIGYLLRTMRPAAGLDRFLPALIFAVFVLEILIIDNVLHASDVVAAALAIAIWPVLRRGSWRKETPLAVLLLLGVLLAGLSPFTFNAYGSDFNWLPFHGFLSGSMYLNALSAAQKVFVFGSLVFLLRQLSLGYAASIGLVFVVVLFVEIAQTRLVGHTPEITDPILVLFAALALVMLSERPSHSKATPSSPSNRGVRTARSPILHDRLWVTHTVNMHEEQLRFLELLANEMGVSVSRAARRIVANFIKENDSKASDGVEAATGIRAIEAQRVRSKQRANRASDNWVRLTVNLRRNQFEWLSRASETLDISVSRVTRYIVGHFIEQLDEEPAIGPEKNR